MTPAEVHRIADEAWVNKLKTVIPAIQNAADPGADFVRLMGSERALQELQGPARAIAKLMIEATPRPYRKPLEACGKMRALMLAREAGVISEAVELSCYRAIAKEEYEANLTLHEQAA